MSEELRHEPSDYFWDTSKDLEAELALARATGDKQAESKKLGSLGGLYCFHWPGDIGQAVAYYQQALAVAREIGDKHLEANHLDGLGTCYGFTWAQEYHDYPKAIGFFDAALAIAREIGDRTHEAECLGHLGILWKYQDDFHQALNLLERAAAIAHETKDVRHEAGHLSQIGRVYGELKDYAKAAQILEEAVSVYLGLEDSNDWSLAYTLGYLAETYHHIGDNAQAARCLSQGFALVRQMDESHVDAFNSRYDRLQLGIADSRHLR
jgi:tetratricopeptide (TPR) repeat protein